MRKPLLIIGAFLILGILADHYINPSVTALLVCFGLFSMLFLTAYKGMRENSRLPRILLFILAALAGAILYHSRQKTFPSNHLARIVGPERRVVEVRGKIISLPETEKFEEKGKNDFRSPTRTRFELAVNEIISGEGPGKATGKARVVIYDDASDLFYGDVVRITGKIFMPPGESNPGQFDYADYLRKKAVHALIVAPLRGNVELIEKDRGNFAIACTYRLKRIFEEKIIKHLGQERAGFFLCILLGERYMLKEETREAFINTGVYHFLVISGLHLAIIVSFFLILFNILRIPTRLSMALTILIIIFFAIFTGFRPSILRAGLMGIILCMAQFLERPYNTLNSVSLSALLILIVSPTQVFDAGFQLSYTAVIGIVCLTPPLQRILEMKIGRTSPLDRLQRQNVIRVFFNKRFSMLLAASLSAWIVITPLQAYYFNRVTPAAIFLNLLIFPLIWIILVLGFIGAALSLFSAFLGGLFFSALQAASGFLNALVEKAASASFSPLYVSTPPVLSLLTFYAASAAIAFRKELKLKRRALAAVLGVLCIVLAASIWSCRPHQDFSVTTLAVGQGSCTVIRNPDGTCYMYDAGARGTYDVGEGVISPYLFKKGIRRIDVLILSHPHEDHFNGVKALVNKFRIGKVILPATFFSVKGGTELLKLFAREDIPYYISSRSDVERMLGQGFKLIEVEEKIASVNESSVSLLITSPFKVLLTGDIEKEGLLGLMERVDGQKVDVLLVPHHGSDNKYLGDLLERISPTYAVVSSAYYFQNEKSIQECAGRGIKVLKTCDSGAVRFELINGKVQYYEYRKDPQTF